MPSFTLIPSESGSPINFTAAVPVDDMNMVGFTVTWRPDRPMTADDIRTIESWMGPYAEVDPRTFEPVASRANDYLLDRDKQRDENFTGMRGIREQDIAVQENQYGGPIADRTKEHLGTSDRRHYRASTPIAERSAQPQTWTGAARASLRRRLSRASNRRSRAP